jgi:hypothetical protein
MQSAKYIARKGEESLRSKRSIPDLMRNQLSNSWRSVPTVGLSECAVFCYVAWNDNVMSGGLPNALNGPLQC